MGKGDFKVGEIEYNVPEFFEYGTYGYFDIEKQMVDGNVSAEPCTLYSVPCTLYHVPSIALYISPGEGTPAQEWPVRVLVMSVYCQE